MSFKPHIKYSKFHTTENYKRPLDRSFNAGELMINLCEHVGQ